MFYSQCLLSRKGPLGGVWVAAYCHKRLKKIQVTHTDIPFSVDKILLEGIPNITYRVLGYLLLGVVRIYSKKVEYFCDDCNEVFTNIKKVPIKKNVDAQEDSLCAPNHTITLPDCFELDAFDFEVPEDVHVDGSHMLPREEIMFKDTGKDKGIQNHFLDEYMMVAINLETFPETDALADHDFSPHLMDMDTAKSSSHNSSCLETNLDLERVQDDRSFEENRPDFEIFKLMEESPSLVEKNNEKQQTDDTIKLPEIKVAEIVENPDITEQHNTKDSEAIAEKDHDNNLIQEEACEDVEMFCGPGEENPISPEVTKAANGKSQVTVNATPEPKIPNAPGAVTPESMAIPTPAIKERARISNKRKCLLDKEIVISNKMLKENINDSSGLVCKRRKVPHKVLDVWKASLIPKLSQDFFEPLTPCVVVQEIKFLLENRNLKSEEPVEKNGEDAEKLNLPEPTTLTVDIPFEQTTFAPETPVQISAPKAALVTSPEHIHHSASISLFKETNTTFSDRMSPCGSFETSDKNTDFTANQDLDIDSMNEELNAEELKTGEMDGWSVRTRTVARYLQRSFSNQKRKCGESVVNMVQLLSGRKKKESARFFYEILVLKTKGLVHVNQESAFADIIVKESPRFEECLGT